MSVVTRNSRFRGSVSIWKKSAKFLSGFGNNENHPNIVKSPAKDVEIPDVTIPEMIYSKIQQFPNLIATESPTTGRKYAFDQIRIKSRNLSKNLRKKLQLNPGDVIGFMLPNIPEYVICFLGSLEAQLIVTTMNPIYTSDEIFRQIIDSSPKAIITLPPYVKTVRTALNMAKKQMPLIVVKETQQEAIPDGTIDLFELINTEIDIPDFQPGKSTDIAVLPYSSGTTGMPKGVEIMHRNIISNLVALGSEEFNLFMKTTDSGQDIVPAVLPFYHIYGMVLNFISLWNGVKSLTLDKFTPESYLSTLKNYPCTIIVAAPPLVLFLTAHPDVKVEYFKKLRVLTSGAAPLGYLDEERFIQKVGRNDVRIMQGYGLTEMSPAITQTPQNNVRTEKNGGSVGQPLPNTMYKIINLDDPQGTPLRANKRGEILVKGPQVMKGYHNKPEETKQAFLDGWFRTGDIGYYNEDKYLFISDRLKELIKVKGYQVAPAELEEIIRSHPQVSDAAVIGIPHERHGEVPRAYVIPKKNKSFNLKELDKFVTEKVAPYKQLVGGIEVVDVIPKNATGKILRRTIKDEYLAQNV